MELDPFGSGFSFGKLQMWESHCYFHCVVRVLIFMVRFYLY